MHNPVTEVKQALQQMRKCASWVAKGSHASGVRSTAYEKAAADLEAAFTKWLEERA